MNAARSPTQSFALQKTDHRSHKRSRCNVFCCCGKISSWCIIQLPPAERTRVVQNQDMWWGSSGATGFISLSFRHCWFSCLCPDKSLLCCSVTLDLHHSQSVSWCFAVALNFQSLGYPMDLNDGRFQDNGGCGYVLKPAVLTCSQRSFDPSCSQRGFKPTHLLLKVQRQSSEHRIM